MTWKVDAETSRRLARVRQQGTSPENLVRQLLSSLGVRLGRPKRKLPGSPDIVSLKHLWAVQVHGCFWHQHPGCTRATVPKNNRQLWREKFAANRERDARLARALRAQGFRLLIVWECDVEERPDFVAAKLARFVRA